MGALAASGGEGMPAKEMVWGGGLNPGERVEEGGPGKGGRDRRGSTKGRGWGKAWWAAGD